MNEGEFQGRILDYAALRGWMRHHVRAARMKDGTWRTPLQGDAGYPDLTLARRGVLFAAELKSDTGKATPGQLRWLQALGGHGRLWSPSDWPEIVETLA